MLINWNKTILYWKPSKNYYERVTEKKEIDWFIESLQYICNNLGDGIKLFGTKTKACLDNDRPIDKFSVIELLAQQLQKHRGLYRAMTNQSKPCYELPFYLEEKKILRYTKILYEKGNVVRPEKIFLSYHPDEKNNEVYHE